MSNGTVETRKTRNWLNYDSKSMGDGLNTTMVSETVPDQSLTMQELIERFVQNRDVPGLRNFEFDDEDTLNLPEIAKMSTIDRVRFLDDVSRDIQDQELKLKDIQLDIKTRKENAKKVKTAPKPSPDGPEEPE